MSRELAYDRGLEEAARIIEQASAMPLTDGQDYKFNSQLLILAATIRSRKLGDKTPLARNSDQL